MNQAVSFQTPQQYYTIQVPQISLQYSGHPTTNVQDQLITYGKQFLKQSQQVHIPLTSLEINKPVV